MSRRYSGASSANAAFGLKTTKTASTEPSNPSVARNGGPTARPVIASPMSADVSSIGCWPTTTGHSGRAPESITASLPLRTPIEDTRQSDGPSRKPCPIGG